MPFVRGMKYLRCPACKRRGVYKKLAEKAGDNDAWVCRYEHQFGCEFFAFSHGEDRHDRTARAALKKINPDEQIWVTDFPEPDVLIFEDNAGSVYVQRIPIGESPELPAWNLGQVTRDLVGRAADHAKAFAEGEWEPNEEDGQSPTTDLEGLQLIGTWSASEGLTIVRNRHNEPLAGAGGSLFLGMRLDDRPDAPAYREA